MTSARSGVLSPGDRFVATGKLVHDADGDWFDPPMFVSGIGYVDPPGPPAPVHTKYAIRIDGADFTELVDRYERDGSIEGLAAVRGVWLEDRLQIDSQDLDLPVPDRRWLGWNESPCPPPSGGWPRCGDGTLRYDAGDLEATGAAVAIVYFHPGPDQEVLVVAAADRDAVERQLRPQLGDSLCVVASRWTKDQIDAVKDHLRLKWETWGVNRISYGSDKNAQVTVRAYVVRTTDEIADWADVQPDGLVEICPTIRPLDR